MADATPSTTVTLKLLIVKTSQKVVYAEAEKPFVDFLFHLMSFPLGTIIKLVSSSMVGSLGNLYNSIQTLNETYLLKGVSRDVILNPKTPFLTSSNVPLLLGDEDDVGAGGVRFYLCGSCYNYFSESDKVNCSACRRVMTRAVTYVPPVSQQPQGGGDGGGDVGAGGFVRGVATYMVMDDLKVIPQSTISAITILSDNNVKDFGSLEVKLVNLGVKEGLEILKASLHTKSVLTTVFMPKKRAV